MTQDSVQDTFFKASIRPKKSGKTYLVEPKQGLLVVWLKA